MLSAVVVDVVRLASGRGKPGGALSATHPVGLLSTVLRALMDRNGLESSLVDDVIVGCVQQVGEQSMNVARQALLSAGFPESVPGVSVDRQCGSSQQAAHFAAQGVMAGAYGVVIAAGVESMSRIPLGTSAIGQDTLGPGIAGRYPVGLVNQGVSAELIAARWHLEREVLDRFAAESHRRAAEATAAGLFAREIVPIGVVGADGSGVQHLADETVRPSTTAEGLAGLRPSFEDAETASRFPEINWSITVGNSSPLTDGASAALIMSEEMVTRLGLVPRVRFVSFAVVGDDPLLMLAGPIPATRKVLARAGMAIGDLDAYEVNEAFASIPLAWAAEFDADPARLNPRGGAIALGHALGSSGVRLLTTLVSHLEHSGGRFGLQVMCEGGGLANATIIERLG